MKAAGNTVDAWSDGYARVARTTWRRLGLLHALSRRVTYRGIPAGPLRAMTTEDLQRSWAERIARESGTHRLYVAEAAGEALGFSYVGPGDEFERVPPDTGVLYAIHVHPDAQGTGVGGALMDAYLRTFAEWRQTKAILWVLKGNERARRFYQRTGWRHDGTVRDSPIGDVVTRQLRYVRPVGDRPCRHRPVKQSPGTG